MALYKEAVLPPLPLTSLASTHMAAGHTPCISNQQAQPRVKVCPASSAQLCPSLTFSLQPLIQCPWLGNTNHLLIYFNQFQTVYI